MGSGRTWTEYEIEYLKEHWGVIPLKNIAKKLNRTKTAIHLKVKREKLGAATRADEYITPSHLAKLLKVDSHAAIRWIKKHNLKAVRKIMLFKRRFYLINHSDLCKWLENNQDRFDSRKVELFSLGYEPQWLHAKRIKDRELPKNRFKKWTALEVQRIVVNYEDMKYKEIAQLLGRSYISIDHKINRLRCQPELLF